MAASAARAELVSRITNGAIRQAATMGIAITAENALRRLEDAAETLGASLAESKDPGDQAKLGQALAAIHAMLAKVRKEAEAERGRVDPLEGKTTEELEALRRELIERLSR